MAEFSNEQPNINPEAAGFESVPRSEGEGRVFEAPVEAAPERAAEFAPAQPTPAPAPVQIIPKEEVRKKVGELKLLGEEEQIKHLSDLAFHKGIGHAVEVAQNLDNPYLLDKFHDTVIDRLYQELVKRGMLKKI